MEKRDQNSKTVTLMVSSYLIIICKLLLSQLNLKNLSHLWNMWTWDESVFLGWATFWELITLNPSCRQFFCLLQERMGFHFETSSNKNPIYIFQYHTSQNGTSEISTSTTIERAGGWGRDLRILQKLPLENISVTFLAAIFFKHICVQYQYLYPL